MSAPSNRSRPASRRPAARLQPWRRAAGARKPCARSFTHAERCANGRPRASPPCPVTSACSPVPPASPRSATSSRSSRSCCTCSSAPARRSRSPRSSSRSGARSSLGAGRRGRDRRSLREPRAAGRRLGSRRRRSWPRIALSVDSLWACSSLLVALLGFGVAVVPAGGVRARPAAAGERRRRARQRAGWRAARSLGFTAGPAGSAARSAPPGCCGSRSLIDAASFVVVAVAGSRCARGGGPRSARTTRVRARDGFAFLLGDRAARDHARRRGRRARAVHDVSQTAEPFFVTDVLGAGSLGYGLLITAWTLGMAAGAAGLAHRVPARGVAVVALVAVVAQGLGIAGAGAASTLALAMIGFAFGGIAHGVKNVAAAHADPRARARGAARPRVRRLQRRPQRRRARRARARRRPRRPRSAPARRCSPPASGPR